MGNCNNPQKQKVQSPKKKPVQLPLQKGLNLVIKCWKQTHNNLFNFNLFDRQLNSQTINIMLKKVRVVKLGQQYQALFPKDEQFHKIMPPVMIDISQLKQKDQNNEKKYFLLFNQFPKISKPFWIVIKSLPLKRYLLKQGDIFKMGKIKLRIKEIVDKNTQTRDLNKKIEQSYFRVYNCQTNVCQGVQKTNDQKCRICMQQGQKSNPLIGLCECSGTSKYTHFNCLRQWFTTQINPTKINMVTQVNWKTLQCQFCKTKLPYSITIDNDLYYLVSFPKIKKPYLVLNPVYKGNNQKSRIYYFISFKKKNRMVIGRKADNDIQLCSDATLSRNHAIIQYIQKSQNQNGKFYLSDNKSKFGTVVLLNTKNPIPVDTKMNDVQFQVGGDLIKITYNTKNPINNPQKYEIDFNQFRQGRQEFRQFNQDQEQSMNQQIASENDKNNENYSQTIHQTSDNNFFIVK